MKKLIAILGIILGISIGLYGLYLGIVVMLIGGIVDIINQIKAPNTNANLVAYGIAKIMFAEFACSIVVAVGTIITFFSFSLTQED